MLKNGVDRGASYGHPPCQSSNQQWVSLAEIAFGLCARRLSTRRAYFENADDRGSGSNYWAGRASVKAAGIRSIGWRVACRS